MGGVKRVEYGRLVQGRRGTVPGLQADQSGFGTGNGFQLDVVVLEPMQRQQFAGPNGNSVVKVGYGEYLSFENGEGFDLGTCDDKINRIARRNRDSDKFASGHRLV